MVMMQEELEEGRWMLIPVGMTFIAVLAILVSTRLELKRFVKTWWEFYLHGKRFNYWIVDLRALFMGGTR